MSNEKLQDERPMLGFDVNPLQEFFIEDLSYGQGTSREQGHRNSESCPDNVNVHHGGVCLLEHEVGPLSPSEMVPSLELPRNVCPESCVVCGDKASGYHYEVPSCNGCKTFFRRTLLNQKKYECKKDGKCFDTLPKEQRIKCRGCRFEQCVKVGMNPLSIQVPESHKSKKNAMLTNLVKRKAIECEPSTSRSPKVQPLFTTYENSVERVLDQLVYLDLRTDQMRKSRYNPDPFEFPELKKIIERPNVLASSEMMEPMPNWPLENLCRENPPQAHRAGTDADHLRPHPPGFVFQHAAHDHDGQPNTQRCQQQCRVNPRRPMKKDPNRKYWTFFDLLCAIEYAKTFPSFNRLALEDKIILLKHVAVLCSNLTQAFYSYNQKSETLLLPDGTNPPRKSWRTHSRATSALIRLQLDQKEYVLLKAMLLCNAAVPGLSAEGQKIVSSEREKFALALLSYCLASKGVVDGPSHYSAIIGIVDALELQAQEQRDFFVLLKIQHSRDGTIQLMDDCF